jgi:hypothetical protein
MLSEEDSPKWLKSRTKEYHSLKNNTGELADDFDDIARLRQGFSPIDELSEVDLGVDGKRRPMYVSVNLIVDQREQACQLLSKFVDYFAWDYTEMPGLDRDLVEHWLPIKQGFQPYK